MTVYEYRVIPAPTKGRKAQGIKGAEARFAHALQEIFLIYLSPQHYWTTTHQSQMPHELQNLLLEYLRFPTNSKGLHHSVQIQEWSPKYHLAMLVEHATIYHYPNIQRRGQS